MYFAGFFYNFTHTKKLFFKMNISELVKKNRSYRRFRQETRISRESLTAYIDLARHSASATKRQPLKYLLYTDESDCSRIFPYTRWAGYLKDWDGPEEGERPSAYIIILGDRSITDNYYVDHGIAAQSILLGAVEDGYGGCIIASIDRKGLVEEIRLSDKYEVLLILALGKPAETVVIDNVKDGDIKYWRDENSTHHVPKRGLDELIINK